MISRADYVEVMIWHYAERLSPCTVEQVANHVRCSNQVVWDQIKNDPKRRVKGSVPKWQLQHMVMCNMMGIKPKYPRRGAIELEWKGEQNDRHEEGTGTGGGGLQGDESEGSDSFKHSRGHHYAGLLCPSWIRHHLKRFGKSRKEQGE